MFVINFITEHYIMLMELVGLFILLTICSHFSARIKRLTRAVGILLVLTSIMAELEKWMKTFDKLCIARPLLNAAIYSIYPVILILTMLITTEKLLTARQYALLLLGEAVSVPLYFTSQWTHWMFWVSENNEYMFGPIGKWPYVLFGFYSFIFFAMNMYFLRRSSVFNRIIAGFIVTAPLVGVAFYAGTGYSSDYTTLFTSAIILYYLFFYIYLARIDALTGLLNRKSFYQDIKTHVSGISAVVSVDMNNLKYINDNFGHDAGDTAIRTVAKVLGESSGRLGTAYRIGGDEFVILYRNSQETYVSEKIANMRAELAKTSYTCAFGYAMKADGMNVDAMLRDADEKMYENKTLIKGSAPR